MIFIEETRDGMAYKIKNLDQLELQYIHTPITEDPLKDSAQLAQSETDTGGSYPGKKQQQQKDTATYGKETANSGGGKNALLDNIVHTILTEMRMSNTVT